jgi:phospholipid/cholesterol/gamma-HCH transport system ATP-binding protein
MSESQLDEVRLKLGMVFQYAALFDSLSVYDNIAFGVVRHRRPMRDELDKLVKDRLEDVGLEGVERLHPSELSGGMQKRVGLARALAMNPAIVFYDEPTSGLDPITEYRIDALIMSMRERRHVTSIVVSHHLPSIFRISDRVAMLHAGRIAFVGTPDEIRSSTLPEIQAFVYPETQLPFRAQEHEDFI